MEKVYKIGKSEIEGEGLIAIKDLVAGDLVGMSHSNGQPSSEIGQYYNHSDSPNAVSELVGNDRYVIASSPIKAGEEIVVDYRKQPELEQPEDFINKAQDGGNPFEPQERVGVKNNPDGSHSTHLMRTETIDGINWVSFPTLFQNPDGSWLDMSNEENWKIPMMEAKRRGELVHFGADKKAALEFGKGSWKSDEKSIMDREQTIPMAQYGLIFKGGPTKGQIGSGIGGNTVFRNIKGLPAANTFHTNWYTHPDFIKNTNIKHNWNLRDFNENLISNEVFTGAGASGLPIVHKSALVKQPDGTFQIDKSQVDPIASKFSLKDYESGIVPKDFFWVDQWRGTNPVPYSATGENIYEKFPFAMSMNFVPTTRLNPDNLQISGLYDEFKYNMAKMPERLKHIYNSEFLPNWKKPGYLTRSAISPISQYLGHSISIGGHASHMTPGDRYMPNSRYGDMYPINAWRINAPSLDVYKGFSNTPISGQMSLNYNPLMKIDPFASPASVVVHERGHLMDNSGGIYPNKYRNMFSSAVKEPSTGFFSKLDPMNRMGFGYDYFTNPTEQYARMMQERHRLGLTPADKYTFDMFKQNKGMFGMGKYLLKDESGVPVNFIKNMNTIYKEGGDIPKAKGGGWGSKLFGTHAAKNPFRQPLNKYDVQKLNMANARFNNPPTTTALQYSPTSMTTGAVHINDAINRADFLKRMNTVSPLLPPTNNVLDYYPIHTNPLNISNYQMPWNITDRYNNPNTLWSDKSNLGMGMVEGSMFKDHKGNPVELTNSIFSQAKDEGVFEPKVRGYHEEFVKYRYGRNALTGEMDIRPRYDGFDDLKSWDEFIKDPFGSTYIRGHKDPIKDNKYLKWSRFDENYRKPIAGEIASGISSTDYLKLVQMFKDAGNPVFTGEQFNTMFPRLYHGSASTFDKPQIFDLKGKQKGKKGNLPSFYITDSPSWARSYAGWTGDAARAGDSPMSEMSESALYTMNFKPDAKIKILDGTEGVKTEGGLYSLTDEVKKKLRDQGYDAITHYNIAQKGLRETIILNEDAIVNFKQLSRDDDAYSHMWRDDWRMLSEQEGRELIPFTNLTDDGSTRYIRHNKITSPYVDVDYLKSLKERRLFKDGGSLPKAQFGKGFKIQPRKKPNIITNISDDINLYKYNRATDAFGITGANLSGSVVGPQNYSGSLLDYRGLSNSEAYDPATMFLMNEYTIDSAPFKFTAQDWKDNAGGWSLNTAWPDKIHDESLKFALSNKIQGNTIGWRNSSRNHLPIHLTRNFNLGENTLLGVHGDIGQLTSLLKSGDPYQLGSISSWSVGTAGSPQFGKDRYVIKDFETDYPALLNEYKNLTNNQAKVWKERELLLDNPNFQVTNIIENAPRIPYWRITTSPETTLKSAYNNKDWKIGEDVLNPNMGGGAGSVITRYNPFDRYIMGKKNPYYQSLYDASIFDPNFRIKAIPEYGTDIELKIIKKKGGEIMKKSKYQDSPFTEGKITYSDPTEVLNNLISQGIFTSEFKMGGEKKLDNGFTVKKEFDIERNIPYVTYMKEPSIEGRLYYDSDSENDLNDFNVIDVESELIKRKIKHKRTKDIILKYQNGEELSNAERARLNSLGLLD